jgi:hypothetical protein
MRFPTSLLLKVFFCRTKSWLLGLIVKNTHLNIASQVKMHIKMYLKVHFKHRKLVKNLYLCLLLDKTFYIKFLTPLTLSTCPARSGGLGEPPPVRELSMQCPLIKREQSHWGRSPMTHNSEMLCKKINYRLNRPKLDKVRASKYS